MSIFIPQRVFFEKEALHYPLGEKLWQRFREEGVTTSLIGNHNRVTGIPGKTPQEAYREAKQSLVIGVRKTLNFETCKPSAHYQLPLATSCVGKCEYCYLNTTLGKKPYLRIYVNLEEILDKAAQYIKERSPEITFFEGAATSDPLPFEPYTGALNKTISFFASQEWGRFRFVTKFTGVESLLQVHHGCHTRFRFSINTQEVIGRYEHQTPGSSERVLAAEKVARAGYPLGFIIAPVILYPNWQEEYGQLLIGLAATLPEYARKNLTFEVITHRYTTRAKANILEVFPHSNLPMNEEERQYKYGQFGYGKYVYPKEQMAEVKAVFNELIRDNFPGSELDYIV